MRTMTSFSNGFPTGILFILISVLGLMINYSVQSQSEIDFSDLLFEFPYSYEMDVYWDSVGIPKYVVAGVSQSKDLFVVDHNFNQMARLDVSVDPNIAAITTGYGPRNFAWSPDGLRLAVVINTAVDDYLQIWNVSEQTVESFTFGTGVSRPLSGEVDWSPNGRYVYVSREGGIGILDTISGQVKHDLLLLPGGDFPDHIAWKSDSQQVGATNVHGVLRIWNVETGGIVFDRSVTPNSTITPTDIQAQALDAYSSLAWEPNNDHLALYNSKNSYIEIWDISQESIVTSFYADHSNADILWSEYGLASYGYSNKIKIWDVDTGNTTEEITFDPNDSIVHVEWNPYASELFYAVLPASSGSNFEDIVQEVPTQNQGSPLITNISVTGSTRTYTRQPNLAVGSTAYTDRVYTYKTVPSQYLGSEYIQTANDDKQTNPFTLNFTLTAPARVYVALDSRSGTTAWPVPPWLSTWQVDPQSVIIGDASMSITHRMYYKDFITGNVSLGNNGALSPHMMYTVIAVPN